MVASENRLSKTISSAAVTLNVILPPFRRPFCSQKKKKTLVPSQWKQIDSSFKSCNSTPVYLRVLGYIIRIFTNFKKSRSHFNILDARRLTWIKFHTEGPEILGATGWQGVPGFVNFFVILVFIIAFPYQWIVLSHRWGPLVYNSLFLYSWLFIFPFTTVT